MFTAKTPINIIAAIGLGLGAVFGERAIAIWLGSTGNGRNPMFNGRRQPSCGGTSRMMRECQVRFREGLGVKFPGPARQPRPCRDARYRRKADVSQANRKQLRRTAAMREVDVRR